MYKFVSIAEVQSQLKPGPVMFDTETIGFYGEIRLAQFYQPHMDEVLFVEYPMKNAFEFILLIKDLHIVCHNATYDVDTIQRQLGSTWIPKDFDCTLYLSRLRFHKQLEFKLDQVMTYVLGYDPYAKFDIDKTDMHKADWSGELSEKQLIYAAIDVKYLVDVYKECKDFLEDFNYKLDKVSLTAAWTWQNNGFPLDIDRCNEAAEKIQEKIKEEALEVNCNSPKQVREFIGSNNSDGLGLAQEEYAGNKRAAKVRKVRKLTKQLSFITKWLNTEVDGRIFGLFQPSARSGRYTCKEQNLQQLPRKLKGCFGVKPGSGKVLIFADFSGLELRSIAAILNEIKMVPLMRQNKDIHDYVANMIFGANFTKENRQVAKMANFLLLYAGGVKMFVNSMLKDADMYLTEQEAGRIKFRWRNAWMTIANWQDQGAKKWRAGMTSSTPLGRRYSAKLLTDFLNIQVSGFGADIAKLAMHRLLKELTSFKDKVTLNNFVHDSYLLVCDDDEKIYKEVSEILARVMQQAWFECAQHTKVPDLPMPVKVFVGYNWGDIEDGDYIYKHEIEGQKYYEA